MVTLEGATTISRDKCGQEKRNGQNRRYREGVRSRKPPGERDSWRGREGNHMAPLTSATRPCEITCGLSDEPA